MAKLTPKQQRFVEEYLCDLNATGAAIRAGYSIKAANQIGNEMRHSPRVAEAIDKAMAALTPVQREVIEARHRWGIKVLTLARGLHYERSSLSCEYHRAIKKVGAFTIMCIVACDGSEIPANIENPSMRTEVSIRMKVVFNDAPSHMVNGLRLWCLSNIPKEIMIEHVAPIRP